MKGDKQPVLNNRIFGLNTDDRHVKELLDSFLFFAAGRDDDDINTDYAESDVMISNDARQNGNNNNGGDNNNGHQQQQKNAYRDYWMAKSECLITQKNSLTSWVSPVWRRLRQTEIPSNDNDNLD